MASSSEDPYPEITESEERERNIVKNDKFSRLLLKFLIIYWRSFVVILWPLILIPILTLESEKPLAMKCLYIVALMAMFWVTEVLPLPITGLIPIVLYPLMGIMSTNDTCLCYMNDTTMMFLGSLVIAVVIENSGLHMRVALLIIKTIGCSHRRLTLGLFFVTMFISMWISNTAATAMMIPIMETVLIELETQGLGNMFVQKEGEVEEESTEMYLFIVANIFVFFFILRFLDLIVYLYILDVPKFLHVKYILYYRRNTIIKKQRFFQIFYIS